ncbi:MULTISPECIES: helix-turn-helix domain-containing protein [Pasteurellaceae]|uniref:DNA binding domain, excisionase family n=1 Tax=Avibacterium paragallinarum TaxID=728 RepID=A0A377I7N5_AVIPA|nr:MULTISPECIES: helix-turn-helix domain-containing protein [Pasteurellaceae]POY47481.1 helix-turn-helix domain-containing protein [Avibacterium paragallinarum]QCA34442.1 helix-turn-helix domain-containing protein [Pasteurella multocida]QZP16607.1 helix-turn-helix domain-containing protein [Avibacterium paragallinarum]RZN75648.1 helix-turn-helix domain-containing protein [Avibacterium paragallinarum]WAL55881.1 helix-turn-helix domain-containing protein [Avibacterium paragallinarum]
MNDTIDYYFSIAELQERLSISRSTVLRLIEAKKLFSIKIGRQVRIPET